MSTTAPDDRVSLLENTSPSGALRLLFWLRMVAIVSQSALIAYVHVGLAAPLPLGPLAITVGALVLWQALNYRAVHAERRIDHREVTLNLLVDIAAFTSVLYFTGGSTNPFVSLYLVPISLAAISLPPAQAWLVAGVCAAGYSLLWWQHVPLPAVHTRFGGAFDLHLVGMWVNFVIAATLIVLFVGRMAHLVRRRDRELAALREAALRDQQVIELGALAAGTAHEINTPLSTLAILVEELDDTSADPAQKEHLRAMMEEIGVINERLNRIVGRAGAERSTRARSVSLQRFLDDLIGQWTEAHRDIELDVAFDLPAAEPRIVAEATIEQAIRNVLDNAAEASLANGDRRVAVRVACRNATLEVAVTDRGLGLDPTLRDEVGIKILSTKERGLGIGILLSQAALQRFGGHLDLKSGPTGGVEAKIRLPLTELIADAR